VDHTLGFRWFFKICQWTASTARSSDQDMTTAAAAVLPRPRAVGTKRNTPLAESDDECWTSRSRPYRYYCD
jgi:hypothetical protein